MRLVLQVNEAIRLYKVWMKVKVQCDLENAFPSSLAEILCTVAYQRLGNTQAGMQRQKHALDVLAKALEITVAVVDAMRDEESFQPVISSRHRTPTAMHHALRGAVQAERSADIPYGCLDVGIV